LPRPANRAGFTAARKKAFETMCMTLSKGRFTFGKVRTRSPRLDPLSRELALQFLANAHFSLGEYARAIATILRPM
jgi:hypothetical protein